MAEGLNRLGCRWRQVVTATPHKTMAETEAICAHIETQDQEAPAGPSLTRLRSDCQATVARGDVSRGGLTRGDDRAWAHALGWHETEMPCGSVDEASARLRITCGRSCKTSAGIVEALAAWWAALAEAEQVPRARLQSTMANGPDSRGVRTQFLHRMVPCADQIGTPIHLRSSPPSHSTYTPIERCGGMVELPWHGPKLVEVQTMLEWAKSMPWQGLHPRVALSRKVDQKGMALGKKAMQALASRLERHPALPKWDILIRPASAL
jgi:Rhodopirellula transposase DDE domain